MIPETTTSTEIWKTLKDIPKDDLPLFIKKNYPDLWLNLAWDKVNEWRDNQKNQQKLLGDTPDYDREIFTLDPQANQMVNFAFKKYWQDGLLYKSSYLVNWSVGLQTALSDVSGEIEYAKRIDPFVSFEYEAKNFEIQDKNLQEELGPLLENLKPCNDWKRLRLATVRPETKFTDLAVAMHPLKIDLYFNQELFVKKVSTELLQKFIKAIQHDLIQVYYHLPALKSNPIKLVFSKKVDPDFGTGIVKITPGHDLFDYQLYQELVEANQLPANSIQTCIDRSGKLKAEFCNEFAGLTVEQGRLAVIKKLAQTGFVPVKKDFELQRTEILQKVKESLENKDFQVTSFSYIEGQKKLKEMLGKEVEKLEIDWDYEHNVSICERTKTVIEPLISEEFFLNYKKPAVSTGKTLQESGLEGVMETEFFSSDYQGRAKDFLNNINDWCISRNLIWGHKIPVWYNLDVNSQKKFYSFQEIELLQKQNPKITPKNLNLKNLKIRQAKLSDIDKIIDINDNCWVETYPNPEIGLTKEDIQKNRVNKDLIEFRKNDWSKSIQQNPEKTLILEVDSALVGYCVFDKECILAFYMNPNFQSQGLGSYLMQEVLQKVENKQNFYVKAASYNQKAINFYKKHGFEFKENSGVFEFSEKIQIPQIKMVLANLKDTEKNLILPIFVGDQKPGLPGNWVREDKILDTWFSSCLWPLSTLNYLDYLQKKQQVVIIGGGESFDSYHEYIQNLESWKPEIDENKTLSWKENLKITLEKKNFAVYLAKMPNKNNAKYLEWKIWFEKILNLVPVQNLTLIGHSLGGIFLTKYLSENNLSVQNLHIVAAPSQDCGDFSLPKDLSKIKQNCLNIHFYHSEDDQIVPFSDLEVYKKQLPEVKFFEFKDRGHFIKNNFLELESQILKPKIDVSISFAKALDSKAIHDILSESWLDYLPNSKYDLDKSKLQKILQNESSSKSIQKVIINGKDNKRFILKAEFENKILGFLQYKELDTKNILLEELNVLSEARGKQIAKKLFFKVLENYPRVEKFSLTVVEYNHRAEMIYKKIGFIKDENFKNELVDYGGGVKIPEFYMHLHGKNIDLAKKRLSQIVDQKTDFQNFYPTSEIVTAKEIFYVWITRMIVLGKYFTGQVPFKKVIITPTILDEKGLKMSKSLGNGLDPVAAIESFSADSLRMSLLGGMIPNRNVKMGGRIADEAMLKYRNFGNKLWNIARFFESKEGDNSSLEKVDLSN